MFEFRIYKIKQGNKQVKHPKLIKEISCANFVHKIGDQTWENRLPSEIPTEVLIKRT